MKIYARGCISKQKVTEKGKLQEINLILSKSKRGVNIFWYVSGSQILCAQNHEYSKVHSRLTKAKVCIFCFLWYLLPPFKMTPTLS